MAFTTHFSVLDGIKQNDNQAWNRFCALYEPLIRLHGRDCGVGEDSLDDLVQEVFLAISRNSEKFGYDAGRGHFRNYLRRIIRNKANDILRTCYRHARLPLPVSEAEDSELDEKFLSEWQDHVRKHSLQMLREAVAPLHFQIFELINIHNRKAKFVADYFQLPLQTVYSINTRTEEKLKSIVAQCDC